MKVKELILRNYKGFGADAVPISFCDEDGRPNDLTVIIGKNASGKSSILQAIAMLVGAMVRAHGDPKKLNYPGYRYEYIGLNGQKPEVRAIIGFSEEEDLAMRSFYERVEKRKYWDVFQPEIAVDLEPYYDSIRCGLPEQEAIEKDSPLKGAIQHFLGYWYAMKLNGGDKALSENLSKVGAIFWYPEQREATNIHKAIYSGNFDGSSTISNSELRNILLRWFAFRSSPGSEVDGNPTSRDRFGILQNLYESVFPGRTINRLAPDSSPERIMEDALIWFRDEKGQEYELSNASAGERAIFPMLVDFANWEINNSIILIDEIELHLHPPLQQALIKALPHFGKNNQFIITTHSPHVLNMVNADQVRVVKDFEVSRLRNYTLGRDINSILIDVLDVDERPDEYTAKLSHFYNLLEDREFQGAEESLAELQEIWGSMDTEIVRAHLFLQDAKEDLIDDLEETE